MDAVATHAALREPSDTANGRLVRWSPVRGPEEESRDAVVAHYSDGANELWVEVGALLLGAAVAAALVFLASLRAMLRAVEGERAVLSTVAVAGGVVMLVMPAASSVANVAAFSSTDFYDAYEVDSALILFFPLPVLVLWVLVIGLALLRRSHPRPGNAGPGVSQSLMP